MLLRRVHCRPNPATRLFSTVSRHTRIVAATLDSDARRLTIQNEDEKRYSLPFAYAREHTLKTASKEPIRSATIRSGTVTPTKVRIVNDAAFVDWSTGEQTEIDSEWLARHFGRRESKAVSPFESLEKTYWRSDYDCHAANTVDFTDILNDDVKLLEFLKTLERYGMVVINNATSESGQLLKLAKRAGWLKSCIYGNLITVKSVQNHTNLANTNIGLELHGDLPHLAYSPEYQMFHCIEQLSGPRAGAGWYSDGFAVASYLRKEFPHDFDILSKSTVQFQYDVADYLEFNCEHWGPIIKLDRYGDIEAVFVTNSVRGDRFSHKMKSGLSDWYAAYRRFVQLAHNSRFITEVKLSPGQILVFDNLRIFHGRPEYQLKENREVRRLEAVYIDKDAVYAKARELLNFL